MNCGRRVDAQVDVAGGPDHVGSTCVRGGSGERPLDRGVQYLRDRLVRVHAWSVGLGPRHVGDRQPIADSSRRYSERPCGDFAIFFRVTNWRIFLVFRNALFSLIHRAVEVSYKAILLRGSSPEQLVSRVIEAALLGKFSSDHVGKVLSLQAVPLHRLEFQASLH